MTEAFGKVLDGREGGGALGAGLRAAPTMCPVPAVGDPAVLGVLGFFFEGRLNLSFVKSGWTL